MQQRKTAATHPGSVSYAEMGAVTRLIFQRATVLRLNGTRWRVLAAVVALTATFSKYYDSTFVARIAQMADLDRTDRTLKVTKKTLRYLASVGLIVYEPAERDGQRTLIGLPERLSNSVSHGGRS